MSDEGDLLPSPQQGERNVSRTIPFIGTMQVDI